MVGNIAENGALLLRARSFSCDTDGDAEELLVCPWPPEDRHEKTIDISLDPHGQVVATVVASHERELLGQYHMMACVRDIFFNPAPKRDKQGLYSGPFKLWVEWM